MGCAFSRYENERECLCYKINPNLKIKSRNILCLYAIENPDILYKYLMTTEINSKRRDKIYIFIEKYLTRVKVYKNGLIEICGVLCIFKDKFKDLQKSCQFLLKYTTSQRKIDILNNIISLNFHEIDAITIAKFFQKKMIKKLEKIKRPGF